MTTPPSYEYPIVGGPPGFNNGGVNVLQLWSEITDNPGINVDLQTITNSVTTVIITFVSSLSDPTETDILDDIVNAHTPVEPGAPLSATENFGIGYGLSTIPESAQNNTILTDGNVAGLTGNSNFIAGGNSLGSTGIFVGSSMTSAVENVVIGQSTADTITTGSNNTIIGVNAGNGIETGSNNTIYGHAAEVDAENANHRIVIGAGATGTVDNGLFVPSNLAGFSGTNVDNTVVLKNSTTGQIGSLEELGTTGPYPLVSDGFGKIEWNIPEYGFFTEGTGGAGPASNGTYFEITWNGGLVHSSGSLIGIDGNDRITIGTTGLYEFDLNVSYEVTAGNSRVSMRTFLNQDTTNPPTVELSNTNTYSYQRNVANGENSATVNWLGILGGGNSSLLIIWAEILAVQNGNNTTIAAITSGTRLRIKLIKEI